MPLEHIEILAPALLIGLLVATIHAPLGIEVLKRGIVFIDLAIAQIAGLIIVTADLVWHDLPPVAVQGMTLLAACASALLFRWIEKTAPREQEGIIGGCFIVSASIALLILANHPRGGEEIQHILSGQILLASWLDIALSAPFLIGVGAIWLIIPHTRSGLSFFLLLAISITAAVKLVGVYVVFASLIFPALAVNRMRCPGLATKTAIGTSLAAILTGVMLSNFLDLPTGPVLVVTLALAAATVRLILSRRPSSA